MKRQNRTQRVGRFDTFKLASKYDSRQRRGLVLLVVLGMLGLFSLLAVTYMVFASASRRGSVMINRTKLQSSSNIVYDAQIIPLILRGTNDGLSAFAGHSLLGDIYGRNAIEGTFRNLTGDTSNVKDLGAVSVGSQMIPTDSTSLPSNATFCKLALNSTVVINNSTTTDLSKIDDAYNGRVLTMLQGPLAGYSFRVMKYIGKEVTTTDPLEYSVLIDLTELPTDQLFTGPVTGAGTITRSIAVWMDKTPNALFYDDVGNGYSYLMNDALFNGVGYGLSPQTGNLSQGLKGFTNLPQLTAEIPAGYKFPVGLLPSMEYAKLSDINGSSNEGIDVADFRDFWLSNISPNGKQFYPNPQPAQLKQIIPSYHRPELINYIANLYSSGSGWNSRTKAHIKDMLRLIDYACARPLAVSFDGNLINSGKATNSGFDVGTRLFTKLEWDDTPTPPQITAMENWLKTLIEGPWDVDTDGDGVAESVWIDPGLPLVTSPDGKLLKQLAAVQIVDLDSRINANLAGDITQALATYASNMPTSAGNFARSGLPADVGTNPLPTQGAGVGPGELGVGHLLQHFDSSDAQTPNLTDAQFQFSRYLMRARNGGDSSGVAPYAFTGVPGRLNDQIAGSGNDLYSSAFEHGQTEEHGLWFLDGVSPRAGYPLMTRGRGALLLDRNGNMSMYKPVLQGSDGTAFTPQELSDDPYELSQDLTPEDRPFTLDELEKLLRRFDADVSSLSDRLASVVRRDSDPSGSPPANIWTLMSEINNVFTTRSHELRSPPIGFPGRDQENKDADADAIAQPVGNMLEWITLLHEHHYRVTKTAPPAPAPHNEDGASDPSLIKKVGGGTLPAFTPDILRALFPIEFRYNLRMNLNRPFGNGFDNDSVADYDGDGKKDSYVVDDPTELATSVETQPSGGYYNQGASGGARKAPFGRYDAVAVLAKPDPSDTNNPPTIKNYPYDGNQTPGTNYAKPTTTSPTNLNSRQLYARQVYCLAQLVVPQDYKFSTMNGLTYPSRAWYKMRARTLAQWAINVVDFRDQDSVMSRFDYDFLPFGIRTGAGVTIATPPANHSKLPGWAPEAGDVVWGMEYPELLLTETLAFHDTRIRESKKYTETPPPMPKEPKAVQWRIPQGSLFVELVNPRSNALKTSQEVAAVPKELYIDKGGQIALDLTKVVSGGVYGTQPVWRIGITPIFGENGAPSNAYDALINDSTKVLGPRQSPSIDQQAVTQTNQTSVDNTGTPAATQFNGLISDLNANVSATGPVTALANQIQFERMIWFTNLKPSELEDDKGMPAPAKGIPDMLGDNTGTNPDHKVFINKSSITSANTSLPLGSYLAIGPRPTTVLGMQRLIDPEEVDPKYLPSNQRLTIGASQIRATRLDGTLVNDPLFTGNQIKPVVTQIAQAEPPDTSWQGGSMATFPLAIGEGIGINVSEPLPLPVPVGGTTRIYYKRPVTALNTNGGSGYETRRPDAYTTTAGNNFELDLFDDIDGQNLNPILKNSFTKAQTHANFRTLYLQRLADPMQPYSAEWNPYITIDTMSVDLTLFSGENASQNIPSAPLPVATGTLFAFESRLKDGLSMDGGRRAIDPAGPPATPIGPRGNPKQIRSYFSASTAQPVQTIANTAGANPVPANSTNPNNDSSAYFNYELGFNTTTQQYSSATIGYLNIGHTIGGTYDAFGVPQSNLASPNYTGSTDPKIRLMAGLYWPNRDFANPFELALVPYTAPGQFASFYTSATALVQNENTSVNAYNDTSLPAGVLPAPYGYLFNFFEQNNLVTTTNKTPPNNIGGPTPAVVPRREPNWMRRASATSQFSDIGLLMELVETTPRYKETMTTLNPIAVDQDAQNLPENKHTDPAVNLIRDRMLIDFRTPYNQRQSYTNPGKVNINNALFEPVWSSIDWNTQESGTKRQAIREASGGGGMPTTWDNITNARRGYPKQPPNGTYNSNDNIHAEIPSQFAGAWRSPFSANITPEVATTPQNYRGGLSNIFTWRRPLDATNPINATPNNNTKMLMQPSAPALEGAASPLTTYMRMGRLNNLVTNQSNVFAIWITVGLFDYDPIEGLGPEYVGPSGRNDRQRSFYIVDRTVPVAYREGEEFNTEKTILLRRSISR